MMAEPIVLRVFRVSTTKTCNGHWMKIDHKYLACTDVSTLTTTSDFISVLSELIARWMPKNLPVTNYPIQTTQSNSMVIPASTSLPLACNAAHANQCSPEPHNEQSPAALHCSYFTIPELSLNTNEQDGRLSTNDLYDVHWSSG